MSATDFRAQLQNERTYLMRYAALHLRDSTAAEDAVQETLLAALAGEAGFEGRSNLRTWLTGILKHKIIDAIRRASRDPVVGLEDDGGSEEIDRLFMENGHWVEHPAPWQDPDAALEQKRFFEALERCLAKLPKRTSRAFLLREHMGAETGEICKELGVTSTHCFVLLYRARMALQRCLDENWFGK